MSKFDDESIDILLEQEIDKISFNIETGKVKLIKPDISTFSSLIKKWGIGTGPVSKPIENVVNNWTPNKDSKLGLWIDATDYSTMIVSTASIVSITDKINGTIMTTSGTTAANLTIQQASINNNTGLINDDPTNIKVPPAALWKVIDYAKSQNLQVWLSLSIVDSKTDVEFVPNFTKFTEQKMFDSIVAFNKPLAKLAQDHKVDGIYIGEGNLSLESDEHIQYWKYYIDQIKTVYTGKLAYASYCIKKTSIWYHVDYASVFMSGPLSYTPVTDLKSIVALYNKDVYGMDQVAALKDIYNTYGKKLILLLGAKVVDTGVGADPENFFTVMVTNSWGTMAHPTITVNTPMQHLKVQAFFEVVALKLSDVTIGLGFTEFAPWLQDSKFSDPSSSVYNYYCCSWDITNNTDLQKTFNSYLSKPWGYSTIN
jgi:hypothetical protein